MFPVEVQEDTVLKNKNVCMKILEHEGKEKNSETMCTVTEIEKNVSRVCN